MSGPKSAYSEGLGVMKKHYISAEIMSPNILDVQWYEDAFLEFGIRWTYAGALFRTYGASGVVACTN